MKYRGERGLPDRISLAYSTALREAAGCADEHGPGRLGVYRFMEAFRHVWKGLPDPVRRLLRGRVSVVLESGPLRVIGDRERAQGCCSETGRLSFRWPRAQQLPADRLRALIAHEIAHRVLYLCPGTRHLWGNERAVRALHASWGFPFTNPLLEEVRAARPWLLEDQGRWITIGGTKGEDGKRHGGSPVFVKDGRITKGAPGLTGKKLGDMKAAPDEGGHRKQLRQGKEYATARLVKQARKEGIDPKDLHSLAGDILAHDKAHVEERTKALQLARRLASQFGTSLQTLKARAAHGIDADAVKHLDDIADSVASSYPEQFAGHEDRGERLFDMLAEGNPKAMSEKEAYEQALDHLRERAASEPEPWDNGPLWDDDDDFGNPFR
jgi:hypothetical protein